MSVIGAAFHISGKFTCRAARLLFALFLFGYSFNIPSARANGVNEPVQSGSLVNGTVSGAAGSGAIDTYTIAGVPANAYVYAAAAWTPPSGYEDLQFRINRPDGVLGRYCYVNAYPFQGCGLDAGSYTGTWTVKIFRGDGGTPGGDYSLTFLVIPMATGLTGGGGSMLSGQTYTGAVVENSYDLYSFQGISGQSLTVNFGTTGGTGLSTSFVLFDPSGILKVSRNTPYASQTYNYTLGSSGTWWIRVIRGDATSTSADTYSLSVSGNAVDLPVASKADGDCVPCRLAREGGVAAGIP